MATQQATLSPEDENLRVSLKDIWDELNQGHPRRAIEALLTIEDKMTRALVPFIYNSNQRFMDEAIFQPLKSRNQAINVVMVKDRQATWTSLILGVIFVYVIFFENTHAVVVFQDEDTGKALKKRIDTFWRMLSPLAITDEECSVRLLSSDKAFFEVGFYDRTAGQDPDTTATAQYRGTSSIDIVSAGAKEYGAGIAPTMVFCDELDLYHNLDLVGRLEDGFPPDGAWFGGGTPRGMKTIHQKYTDILDNGGGIALAMYWFTNPDNRLPPGHDRAPFRVQGDFELLPEHLRQIESAEWSERSLFKSDQDIHDAFRWWEWKRNDIRNRMISEFGVADERQVLALMEQDHMSNAISCFLGSTLSPFDSEVLLDYTNAANANPPRSVIQLAPGLTLKVWQESRAGMTYACGMDCAEGYQFGDEIVAYFQDADGNDVARISGRVDITMASRHILQVCKERYNNALFAPEVDGGLGFVPLAVARDINYPNVWRVPPKSTEDGKTFKPYDVRHGWRTQGNKTDMIQNLISATNGRMIRTFDLDLLRDKKNYSIGSQKHTSDRIMARAITWMITHPTHRFGYQFRALAADSGLRGMAATVQREVQRELRRATGRQPVSAGSSVWGQRGR